MSSTWFFQATLEDRRDEAIVRTNVHASQLWGECQALSWPGQVAPCNILLQGNLWMGVFQPTQPPLFPPLFPIPSGPRCKGTMPSWCVATSSNHCASSKEGLGAWRFQKFDADIKGYSTLILLYSIYIYISWLIWFYVVYSLWGLHHFLG